MTKCRVPCVVERKEGGREGRLEFTREMVLTNSPTAPHCHHKAPAERQSKKTKLAISGRRSVENGREKGEFLSWKSKKKAELETRTCVRLLLLLAFDC